MKSVKLKFENYYTSLGNGLINFQQNEEFVDMTIAADGHLVKVHKNVVSLSSPYFKEMIKNSPCSHPVVYLSNVKYDTLCLILEYIYTGEVQISDHKYNDFVKAAKELHIVGISSIKNNTNIDYNKNQAPLQEKSIQSHLPEKNAEGDMSQNKPQLINSNLESLCNEFRNEVVFDLVNEDFCAPAAIQYNLVNNNESTYESSNNIVNSHSPQLNNITNLETLNQNESESSFNNQFLDFATKSASIEKIIPEFNDDGEVEDDFNQNAIYYSINESETTKEECDKNENNHNEYPNQLTVQVPENYAGDGSTVGATEFSIDLTEISNRERSKSHCEKILGKLTYTLTRKAQVQLIYNRFIYYVHHTNKNGRRRFRCIDYRSHNCPALLDMQNEMIVNRKNMHNHHYHDNKIEMQLRKQRSFSTLAEADKISEKNTKKLRKIREISKNLTVDPEMLNQLKNTKQMD